MIDKRDKLTSRLFKAKLEQLLGSIIQINHQMGIFDIRPVFQAMNIEEVSSSERAYTADIHSFIWRKQANSELSKSYLLSKENVKVDDICFTVDVYKFNNQDLNKLFPKVIELEAPSTKSKQQVSKMYPIQFCDLCEKLYSQSSHLD